MLGESILSFNPESIVFLLLLGGIAILPTAASILCLGRDLYEFLPLEVGTFDSFSRLLLLLVLRFLRVTTPAPFVIGASGILIVSLFESK